METKKSYQYVRVAKGGLVRGKEITILINPQPTTVGGLITKKLAEEKANIRLNLIKKGVIK